MAQGFRLAQDGQGIPERWRYLGPVKRWTCWRNPAHQDGSCRPTDKGHGPGLFGFDYASPTADSDSTLRNVNKACRVETYDRAIRILQDNSVIMASDNLWPALVFLAALVTRASLGERCP
jgi:hypothetical protein